MVTRRRAPGTPSSPAALVPRAPRGGGGHDCESFGISRCCILIRVGRKGGGGIPASSLRLLSPFVVALQSRSDDCSNHFGKCTRRTRCAFNADLGSELYINIFLTILCLIAQIDFASHTIQKNTSHTVPRKYTLQQSQDPRPPWKGNHTRSVSHLKSGARVR